MSLSNRITLLMLVLLAALGGVAGWLLYGSVRNTLEVELHGQLDKRLAWIVSSVEVDGQEIEFEPQRALLGGAPPWQIRAGSRMLWGDELPPDPALPGYLIERATLVVGLRGSSVVPEAQYRKMLAVGADDVGKLRYAKYAIPDQAMTVELSAYSWLSTAGMDSELARLRRTLWAVGLPILLVVGLALFAVIRWQLRPLVSMAQHVRGIGPDSHKERIGSAGSSFECVALRTSINGMLDRLAEGLDRERNFASVAAHELRTPLAQLRTHVEVTLRKNRSAGEYRDALQETLTDVDRLHQLMIGLLQLTRNQVATAELGRTGIGEALRKAAERSQVEIPIPDTASNIQVTGSEELLTSAFSNVLENAVIYAPGSLPSIEVESHGGTVQIAIRDFGPGIDPGHRDCIFDPLVRLDGVRTVGDNVVGLGLGLSVARTITRRCGGDLTCNAPTDDGPGSVFTFTFPSQ